MEILIYLVPLALALGLLGLAAFLWTLHSDQYEDLEGAAWRAISDDEIGPVRPAPTPEDEVPRSPHDPIAIRSAAASARSV